LELDSTLPYTGKVGTCNSNLPTNSGLLTNWNEITQNDTTALMNAVANGPVSVAIDASDWSFQTYSSGVYNTCGTNLDHAVLIVGYGSTSTGVDYWIVKNSWGTSWGEKGYVLIERDMTSSLGVCGINQYPEQPEDSFS
jgi:KDEL-tailed cysteine endopeptidase